MIIQSCGVASHSARNVARSGLLVGIGLSGRLRAEKQSHDEHRSEVQRLPSVTDILERLSFSRVINATGTVTRLGASPIDAEVIAAMAAAARCSVDIAELQGHASDIISGCTGAEAGIVTSGAMAGLLVGAAACMTGLDPAKMAKLPDTDGIRNQFIVSRSHRNSYDHGVRAAGAQLVEVGLPDRLT